MRNLFTTLLANIALVATITSCDKRNTELEGRACIAMLMPAYIEFNVVGAGTGADLFFSPQPQYQPAQICFFKIKDKLFQDTIRPQVIGASNSRYFKMQIDNTRLKDTLIMKLPVNAQNATPELLTYTIRKDEQECPQYVSDQAFLNNVELINASGKLLFRR